MEPFAQFLLAVEKAGYGLDARKIGAFVRYQEELLRVNSLLGLISRNDAERIPSRHFLDSLTPALKGVLPTGGRILDIGSGGGFPGIPLAIFMPDTDFMLVESNRKKSTFLRKTRRVLALNNVTVHNDRVESLAGTMPGGLYDGAVARAVASIAQLAAWCGSVLKPDGKLICYKGPGPEEEIGSARTIMEKQDLILEGIYSYDFGASGSSTLVVLSKQ